MILGFVWRRPGPRSTARDARRGLLDGMKPSFFNDCLLAASSIEQGFTIVTHNIADFSLIARVEPRTSFAPPLP